jgi:hypothetical protein
MAAKAAVSSVATLGIPSALDAAAGNTWIEAIEADALQVRLKALKARCCNACFFV